MTAGFQQTANLYPAPGLPGDFADNNPRAFVSQGPGGVVAGPLGVTAGRFAWIDPTGQVATTGGVGEPAGFVRRSNGQALITQYLAETSYVILTGFEVPIFKAGAFWAKNDGSATTRINDKCYAAFADGKVTTGPSGSAPQAASVTGSIAAGTATFTGSISAPPVGSSVGSILTASAVTGTIVPGGALTGTGVAANQKVGAQLSGTPGGAGTYALAVPQAVVTAQALTESYGVMTVTAVGSGALGVGDVLAGTNVTGTPSIIALGTGVGGTGTYYTDTSETAASATITAAGAYETKWYVASVAAPGEVFQMTSTPQG